MRIGFDVRPFLKEETGVGIYYKNLLYNLAQIDQLNEYFLFSSSFKDRFPLQKVPSFAKRHFRDFSIPVKVVNQFWYNFFWPPLDFFFKTKLDLSHSPTPLILPTKGKTVVTVYDLFFMDFPHKTDRETRKFFFRKTKKALQKADGVIAISEFTKNKTIEIFGLDEEKVRVIYLGVDPEFKSENLPGEVEKKPSLPPSFILFVGAFEPRKNLLNLIEALKIIHKEYKEMFLVLAGREGQDSLSVKERIRQNGLVPWVKMAGYISQKELISFYRKASVFVFPSFCEGFGLPLLEAMACGLPVAASQAPAIPEVAQEAALYFDPNSPEEMAEKIIMILEDESIRQDLISKGKQRAHNFDWKDTAAETLAFYNQIVKGVT